MAGNRIRQVVAALQAEGIPAGRSYTSAPMPHLTQPVAAVGIHAVQEGSITLAVQVFAAPGQGGGSCEDTALRVRELLQGLGAQCSLGAVAFDRTSGTLRQELLAQWVAEGPAPCTLKINGIVMQHLRGFSAEKTVREEPVGAVYGGIHSHYGSSTWNLRVEQLLPEGALQNLPDGFAVTLHRADLVEEYPNVRWVGLSRKDTPAGVEVVALGKTEAERRVYRVSNAV